MATRDYVPSVTGNNVKTIIEHYEKLISREATVRNVVQTRPTIAQGRFMRHQRALLSAGDATFVKEAKVHTRKKRNNEEEQADICPNAPCGPNEDGAQLRSERKKVNAETEEMHHKCTTATTLVTTQKSLKGRSNKIPNLKLDLPHKVTLVDTVAEKTHPKWVATDTHKTIKERPLKVSNLKLDLPPKLLLGSTKLSTISEQHLSPEAAIRKVIIVLKEYLNPSPIIDGLRSRTSFPLSPLRNVEDLHGIEKTEQLLRSITSRRPETYTIFKQLLLMSGQEDIHRLLDMTERGEDTSDLEMQLRQKARRQSFNYNGSMSNCPDPKQELLNYYKSMNSTIPISSIIKEHADLMQFYVTPLIQVVDDSGQKRFSTHCKDSEDSKNETETLSYVTSYQNLFVSAEDDSHKYKNIYFFGSTGMGKTLFCQKLALTWYFAHSPADKPPDKMLQDEINIMQQFDFFFLLQLREYDSKTGCDVDALVWSMMSRHLPRGQYYSKKFVQTLLHNKRCLIVLDGLDEWSHPKRCRIEPAIPHNKYASTCTVLTTTREWRFNSLRLSSRYVDREVKICKLDEKSCRKLGENTISFINERVTRKQMSRTVDDFFKEMASLQSWNVKLIPHMLVNTICLWCLGFPIGESKCDFFSNITEFTLQRRHKNISYPFRMDQTASITPKFFERKELCSRYLHLLKKLGKLAFGKFFEECEESALVFDYVSVVPKYLSKSECKYCLKLGLLEQSKSGTVIHTKTESLKLFYQHKAMQEYFAAVYISMEFDASDSNVRNLVLKTCMSFYTMIDLSNIFVFLSGMSPDIFEQISISSQEHVSNDIFLCQYRHNNHVSQEEDEGSNRKNNPLWQFQHMHLQCMKEMRQSKHKGNTVSVQDIWLHKMSKTETHLIKEIIHSDKNVNVKSLNIEGTSAQIERLLADTNFPYLETLKVCVYKDKYDKCTDKTLCALLTKYTQTVKYIAIRASVQTESVEAISRTANLQGLTLSNVLVPHETLQRLFRIVENRKSISHMKLENIQCSKHFTECKDNFLDISKLSSLNTVTIHGLNVNEVSINTNVLEECSISLQVRHDNIESILKTVKEGRTITRLHLDLNCIDHKEHCEGFVVDLSKLNTLEDIEISKVAARSLICSSCRLQKFKYNQIVFSETATASALKYLTNSSNILSYQLCFANKNTKAISAVAKHLLVLMKIERNWKIHSDLPATSGHTPTVRQTDIYLSRDMCQVRGYPSSISKSILEGIQDAPFLTALHLSDMDQGITDRLMKIIPSLLQLEKLELRKLNLLGHKLLFHSKMAFLDTVELHSVRMSAIAWHEFLSSIQYLPLPVNIALQNSHGPSKAAWKNIIDKLKKLQGFCVGSVSFSERPVLSASFKIHKY